MAAMAACACSDAIRLPESIPQVLLDEVLACTRFSSQEVKALYARFRKLAPADVLYLEQFKQALGLLGIISDSFLPDRMFKAFDRKQEGKLDFFQFATSLAIMLRGSEDEKLGLSFEIVAGGPGAKGITFADFQGLLAACNATMSTLLVDSCRRPPEPEEARRLFLELIFGCEGHRPDALAKEELVLTLEAYKEAVRSNHEFLWRLGLEQSRSPPPRPMAESAERMGCQAGDLSHVHGESLEEFKARVEGLHKAVVNATRQSAAVTEGASSPSRRHALFPRLLGFFPCFADMQCCSSAPGNTVEHSWELASSLSGDSKLALEGAQAELDGLLDWCARSRGGDARTVQRPSVSRPNLAQEKPKASKFLSRRRTREHRLLGPKRGIAVHFGHENWNMVINMMLGIRLAVARTQSEVTRDIAPVDFIMKEKFTIVPRLANIFDSTFSKRVTLTRFIDYAPMVFSKIRQTLGVSCEDYSRSIGPEQLLGNMVLGNLSALAELSSEGKSGAFFYYTADGRYMMKTVTRKEHRLLKQILQRYYDHVSSYPNSLLLRFLGMHALEVREPSHMHSSKPTQKLYFVVMANVFNAPVDIHRRYDLKGSWVGRSSPGPVEPGVALKDLDFVSAKEVLNVDSGRRESLLRQMELDTKFLSSCGIIDYSLLVGIHDCAEAKDRPSVYGDDALRVGRAPEALAPSLPAAGGESLYFLGIIDILTPYDASKKVEHRLKGLLHDARGVSCCPPQAYAERFNGFMKKAFASPDYAATANGRARLGGC